VIVLLVLMFIASRRGREGQEVFIPIEGSSGSENEVDLIEEE
jgi:hypothetical protein